MKKYDPSNKNAHLFLLRENPFDEVIISNFLQNSDNNQKIFIAYDLLKYHPNTTNLDLFYETLIESSLELKFSKEEIISWIERASEYFTEIPNINLKKCATQMNERLSKKPLLGREISLAIIRNYIGRNRVEDLIIFIDNLKINLIDHRHEYLLSKEFLTLNYVLKAYQVLKTPSKNKNSMKLYNSILLSLGKFVCGESDFDFNNLNYGTGMIESEANKYLIKILNETSSLFKKEYEIVTKVDDSNQIRYEKIINSLSEDKNLSGDELFTLINISDNFNLKEYFMQCNLIEIDGAISRIIKEGKGDMLSKNILSILKVVDDVKKDRIIQNTLKVRKIFSLDILKKIFYFVYSDLDNFEDLTLTRTAKISEDINDIEKGIEIIKKIETDTAKKIRFSLNQKKMWLQDGYDLDEIAKHFQDVNYSGIIPGKILYFVHSDLPYITSGYTIRTQSVIKSLKKGGLEVEVASRWGFPKDRLDFDETIVTTDDYIDEYGIKHNFDESELGMREFHNSEYLRRATASLIKKCKEIKPSVIISASDHVTGLIGLITSRVLNIPFFYEMRGLWAYTRATNNVNYIESVDYALRMRFEKQCAYNADRVIAISDGLKKTIIGWGINEKKISILPNGISKESILDTKLKKKKEKLVIGYIGSVVPYEGLMSTLKSLKIIKERKGICPKLIIAGDGTERENLEKFTHLNDLGNDVEFLGKIKYENIDIFYNSVDSIILPRLSTKVTDIVPPLKPLEGIGRKKIIISSDIKTHREIFDNINNSFQFVQGNVNSQVEEIIRLMEYKGSFREIIDESLDFILRERNYQEMIKCIIAELFEVIIENTHNDFHVGELILKLELVEDENRIDLKDNYSNIIGKEVKKSTPNIKLISKLIKSKNQIKDSAAIEEINEILEEEIKPYKDEKIRRNIFLAILRMIGDISPEKGHEFFDINEEKADKRSIRSAITYKNRSGKYVSSLFLLDKYSTLLDEKFVNDVKRVASRYSESFSTSADIPNIPILPDVIPKKMRKNINVACILDEFSYECFKYEVNLIKLTKNNFKDVLDNEKIDFLFTESAWNGNDGEFIYSFAGSLRSDNAKKLQEIIKLCNEKNIPTLFWNKEDPVNYDEFIKIAKKFDYILTSDDNCIKRYEKECPKSKIGSLAFACQPVIHNPIRNTLPSMDVSFGGSWYVREHGRRKERLTSIMNGAKDYDLHIYDRNFGTQNRNRFPPAFSKFVKGRLTYPQMRMAYRMYKIMLNTNSVEKSNTMFSRRVFELMASSTAVVSTPSIGMEKMLPDAIVCSNSKDISEAIGYLLNDEIERMKIGHLGLRNVINNHTYYHRMGEILDFMEIEDPAINYVKNTPLVSIVCCTNRPKMVDNILNNYQNQKYKNLEMIVMLQAPRNEFQRLKKKLEKIPGIYVKRQLVKDSLGATFNKGLKFCKGEYIAKFDDDDLYGKNYLTDTIDAFYYTDADVIGKYGVFIFDEKTNTFYFRDRGVNRYLQIVMGATIVAKKSVFEKVNFPDRTTGEDTGFLKKCLQYKYKIYSSNPFNWVLVRKAEEGFHTWDDEGLLISGSKKLPNVKIEDIFI